MTRDDGEKRRRSDDVIDTAQDVRTDLLVAIAKLEEYANQLHREADRRRGREEGGAR